MLNSTRDYHVNTLNTLGWELTVCNSLEPGGTVLRKILDRDRSFGHLLFDYLDTLLPMEKVRKVLEIGGGYGYLMRDFLDRSPATEAVMLDISPHLLARQKETAGQKRVSYREGDFLEVPPDSLKGFDMAILNENLGDFPTLVDVDKGALHSPSEPHDPVLKRTARLLRRYGLKLPEASPAHFNLGAVEAVEKLCEAGIPFIYVGEHSCEATAPPGLESLLHIEPAGNPERIALMGHDEYTIKFSHLEKVAASLGYACIRGAFADFVTVRLTDGLRAVLASGGHYSDEEEMICQFVEDLYKYEYLVLTSGSGSVSQPGT